MKNNQNDSRPANHCLHRFHFSNLPNSRQNLLFSPFKKTNQSKTKIKPNKYMPFPFHLSTPKIIKNFSIQNKSTKLHDQKISNNQTTQNTKQRTNLNTSIHLSQSILKNWSTTILQFLETSNGTKKIYNFNSLHQTTLTPTPNTAIQFRINLRHQKNLSWHLQIPIPLPPS